MKKLQFLALSMLISVSCMILGSQSGSSQHHWTGQGSNSAANKSKAQARIAQEIGSPVTVAALSSFIDGIQSNVADLTAPLSQANKKMLRQNLMDIQMAFKQLDAADQAKLKSAVASVKQNIQALLPAKNSQQGHGRRGRRSQQSASSSTASSMS